MCGAAGTQLSPRHEQSLVVANRQRSQKDTLDERVHRRRASNADRQREDGDERETWCGPQAAKRVADVLPKQLRHHSTLKASTGLSEAARRAGIQPATRPTKASIAAAPAKVPGSRGARPYSNAALTNRDAHQLNAKPAPMPTTSRDATRRRTSRKIELYCAPSAIRMPISPRRRVTACVIRP